jgi:hypothetical protein
MIVCMVAGAWVWRGRELDPSCQRNVGARFARRNVGDFFLVDNVGDAWVLN